MNQNIENSLQQAFGLIEAGKLEDAKGLLRPILEVEKDNADVWWLYSHAVTDTETARLALYNVLRIESDYPDARELLNKLEIQRETEHTDGIVDVTKDPDFIPPMPSSLPSVTALQPRNSTPLNLEDENPPDDLVSDEGDEAFYRKPIFYVPIIALLLIAALAVVIMKPFANNPVPTQVPVSTVDSATIAAPTVSSLAVEASPTTSTELDVTAEQPIDFSAIVSTFSGFSLVPDTGINIVDTSFGKTLLANVCSAPGKEMRELLPKAMSILAKSSSNYVSHVQAIAVRMLDCSTNSTLLWIGSDIGDAIAYAGNSIGDKEFQAKWKPIK